jgi:hypothetical protein
MDQHHRNVRFRLPDPVLKLSPEDLESRRWGNDELLQVQGVGAFVRALLPVRLEGGDTVTYGLWLGVQPEELRQLWEIWNEPTYLDHEFEGWCANGIPPWKEAVLAAPVIARPRKRDEVPYVTASDHPVLASLLEREWPHDFVLSGLP